MTRLERRPSSVFRRVGSECTRRHVDAMLLALVADLELGKARAIRAAIQDTIESLMDEGMTFADLRAFVQALRGAVAEGMGQDQAELCRRLDDWMFELVLLASMRFLAHREEVLQAQAAKEELRRVESQLAELEVALDEKTKLLDMIRQASTPIAPVVDGILVVPLVGTFDSERAAFLTEKLLQEVARARAQTVILDISGVPVVDTDAAQLIIRLSRSVRLIGSGLFLVGLSPINAATIVRLGIELDTLETFSTLRDGLAQALKRQRRKIVSV